VSGARVLFGICAATCLAAPLRGGQAPGWYRVELAAGGEPLTVKLVSEEPEVFVLSFEGSILRVEKKAVKTIKRIALPEDGQAAPDAGKAGNPAAGAGRAQAKDAGGRAKASGKRPSDAALRDAVELLASTDEAASGRAYRLLTQEFGAARPHLHRALKHGNSRVRMMAVKLLGEKGSVKEDLLAAGTRLSDPEAQVRRAAVGALRALGNAGLPALVRYLETESVASNRKAAVQTLKIWNDAQAVGPLVHLLARERDAGVKNFAILALESLTGQKYGKDLAAWQAYLGKTKSLNS